MDSKVVAWTELMERTSIIESGFGDFSCTAGKVDIIYTDVGRFCSIASFVRIYPGNNAMRRDTKHHIIHLRRLFGQRDVEADRGLGSLGNA